MRKLTLQELLKNYAAFAAVSGVTIDAGLLLLDRAGYDVPGDWYINGPLAGLVAVGLPASFRLADRLLRQSNDQRRISGYQEGAGALARRIPLNYSGKQEALLASSVNHIFGDGLPSQAEHRPAAWRVPVDEMVVTVRESELRAFLDAAWKRNKHQFSRRYWTQRRRPALWRAKYEAFMALLVGAGLVEGRHEQGGASGRLVSFPREAIMFLKYESAFRVA